MSDKILAAMQKQDASLTLISEKVANGEYTTAEQLEAALKSVTAAKSNSLKAFNVMAKPAVQGKAGIIAMATDAFDTTVSAIKQVETKATLLSDVIQAELDEMEENKVTDEIEDMDFEEVEASEAADTKAGDGSLDFDDNGIGDKLEEEQIKPTDNTASEGTEAGDGDLDFDDNGSGEKLEEEEIKPTDNTAAEETAELEEEELDSEVEIPEEEYGEEVIESMDDDDGIPELFEEADPNAGEEEPIEASDVKDAMKATAAANGGRKNANGLEACWDFSL